MSTEVCCIPIAPDGHVGHGWGKASTMAIAEVVDGDIVQWRTEDVGWDVLHDAVGGENHHARIVRFVSDRGITVAVAEHMGEPMQVILGKLGIRVVLGAAGDARAAVIAASA